MTGTSNVLKHLANSGGFTLLETMIALAIMVVAFSSILSVESGAITATTRAKQMNVVAMLARNTMIDMEFKVEGKTFDEVKKDDGGTFPSPYEDYRWESKIKEVKLPSLSFGGSGEKEGDSGDANAGALDLMTKLITKNLSKAMRELTVTIFYKKGSGEQSFSVSTYWVDLNHEFELQE